MDFLFSLPPELIYEVLQYISIEALETYVKIPILNTYIINYLYPICLITTETHNQRKYKSRTKIFKNIESLIQFRDVFNYIPQKIILHDTNSLAKHPNFEITCPIELHNNLTWLYYENVYKLVISESCDLYNIPPSITEVSIPSDKLSLVQDHFLHSLEITGFDMNQMTRLPKLLNELILVDFIPCPTLTKLPLNLTKLGIIEGSAYLGSTDLSDLPLKKFTYKGNFKINGLRTPKELHLPYSLESLRLIGLNIVDLNGLFELNHLEVLEIIDCPKLVTFFVSKFPQNLKKLVYKFDLIIPNLTYLQNKLLEYFEPSMLVVEGNSIFFKISDDNFRLPEKLRVFKLENIPYVKISNLTNLPELNELTIKKIPGFVSQSKLKISFPSSLYKLTLNNLMIDSINGLHFPEKLTYLDLSHNQLSSIDGANLYELKHLQELNLSRNRFEKFNGDGVIPDCITNLNLQSNLIDTFDFNQDMELRTLKIMIIRDIRKPSDIKFPHKLFHLQMSIQVDKLSDNFQLPNTLQSLSIHNPYYGKVPITNQFFQSLPSKMNLTDLTLLNLHFSKDCHIVMPKSIEKLTLSGNFTQTIINNMNVTECSNLTMFCISGGSVKHFNLGTLPKSITNLELKNMNLKYISGDFNLFHNLRYLNLEQNQITSLILPRSITTLILNKNDLNDLSNLLFLENCHYNLSKIYLEMNPNLDSKVILKIAKLLMKISNNFCGIYLSSNLLFNSNSYLENYDVYSKFIFNTDFIN